MKLSKEWEYTLTKLFLFTWAIFIVVGFLLIGMRKYGFIGFIFVGLLFSSVYSLVNFFYLDDIKDMVWREI